MENTVKYELIFVLVNKGFSTDVMEASKKVGAKGGTIISSRGGANEKAEKTYGIAITPDKELILILVSDAIKKDVIDSIYASVGIETKGMAIIWSVPADNVIGLNLNPAITEEKKIVEEEKK